MLSERRRSFIDRILEAFVMPSRRLVDPSYVLASGVNTHWSFRIRHIHEILLQRTEMHDLIRS